MTTPRTTSDRSAEALPTSWQRLLALSGIAFAVLLVVGFFLSGGDTPDYTAADQEWTTWAENNELKSRIGAFLTLIAGFVFLHFAGTIRSVLGSAEATVRGSGQLARTAFAGAVTGIIGITMAIVMIAGASAAGADADPVVIRAVASATVGPFLVAAMGFAALLAAAGLLTLRSGVFARWIGIVALLGAVAFFVTFFTLIVGPGEDSVFGYGFFVGFLAIAIWSIATSIASYRAVATTAQEMPATEADS
jgi:succinate dehydrogenase/fumarate reductase cytochrome b subunit